MEISTLPLDAEAEKELLQWGHDFSAMEIDFRDGSATRGSREGASMGPRLFSHGNKANRLEGSLRPRAQLQWGHDFSAMEITA